MDGFAGELWDSTAKGLDPRPLLNDLVSLGHRAYHLQQEMLKRPHGPFAVPFALPAVFVDDALTAASDNLRKSEKAVLKMLEAHDKVDALIAGGEALLHIGVAGLEVSSLVPPMPKVVPRGPGMIAATAGGGARVARAGVAVDVAAGSLSRPAIVAAVVGSGPDSAGSQERETEPPTAQEAPPQKPKNTSKTRKVKGGPEFGDLKKHAQKHARPGQSANQYYNAATAHAQSGRAFTFHHDGKNKIARITRTGPNSFTFTSTNPSGARVYTHIYDVNEKYLNNIGITLPEGF